MTAAFSPRPGPPPGGFRPSPPPSAFQPTPAPQPEPSAFQSTPQPDERGMGPGRDALTGHPAVDAVLQSLANAARLAPAEQIAEYEAAHQVLQETLASIDR